jgi:hypothetical protein
MAIQSVAWYVLWEIPIRTKARLKDLRELHANWSVLTTSELKVSRLKLRHLTYIQDTGQQEHCNSITTENTFVPFTSLIRL